MQNLSIAMEEEYYVLCETLTQTNHKLQYTFEFKTKHVYYSIPPREHSFIFLAQQSERYSF
jgi:hypothetical protein